MQGSYTERIGRSDTRTETGLEQQRSEPMFVLDGKLEDVREL